MGFPLSLLLKTKSYDVSLLQSHLSIMQLEKWGWMLQCFSEHPQPSIWLVGVLWLFMRRKLVIALTQEVQITQVYLIWAWPYPISSCVLRGYSFKCLSRWKSLRNPVAFELPSPTLYILVLLLLVANSRCFAYSI